MLFAARIEYQMITKKEKEKMESESQANGCKSYKTGLVHRLYKADLLALVCDV